MIVLTLVAALGSVVTLKGAHFIRAFQTKQEQGLLCHMLCQAYFYTQIEQVPVKVSLTMQQKQLELKIPELKLVKKFSKISLAQPLPELSFYPHMPPLTKPILLRVEDEPKKLTFYEPKKLFRF